MPYAPMVNHLVDPFDWYLRTNVLLTDAPDFLTLRVNPGTTPTAMDEDADLASLSVRGFWRMFAMSESLGVCGLEK